MANAGCARRMWKICSTPVGTRSSPEAGTTKPSTHSELFGWHSHILNFAVPEKGLDFRRVIKGSASPLKHFRPYKVETL